MVNMRGVLCLKYTPIRESLAVGSVTYGDMMFRRFGVISQGTYPPPPPNESLASLSLCDANLVIFFCDNYIAYEVPPGRSYSSDLEIKNYLCTNMEF